MMFATRSLLFALALLCCNVATAERLRVAVAANFKPTLLQLNARFEADTGHTVVVTSASSGVLATQLLHGAPFDVFFSADEAAAQTVQVKRGLKQERLFCYAQGQLMLVGDDGTFASLLDGNVSLAIANPATAPYGRAALEVLTRDAFAQGAGRKLVRGNNAIQAYQFWHTGAVDAALVPRSLVDSLDAIPVPSRWHRPIDQYAVQLVQRPAVDAYIDWMRSDTVQHHLQEAGYLSCP